jgi:hypothetical protein
MFADAVEPLLDAVMRAQAAAKAVVRGRGARYVEAGFRVLMGEMFR